MIKIYENFFDDSDLKIIHGYLHNPVWESQDSIPDDDSDFQMWDVSKLEYFNSDLLKHVNSKLDSDFTLERVYFNGQDCGRDGKWHPDSDIGYTLLVYLNPDVSLDWGGETEFEETPGVIKQVSPQYNASVIFTGSIPHRGLAFNKKNTPKRISLAFKLLPNTRVFGETTAIFGDELKPVQKPEPTPAPPVEQPKSIAHRIPMQSHIKPAVIIGSAKFDQEVVDEIIAETDLLRESGENYGSRLVGQLKNNGESKQVGFDMENDVGQLLKKLFDSVGDRYLQEMLEIEARSNCFEVWTNHAYAGDYNPLHTHGTTTLAGLSGFMWLKNPPCIEEKWNELIQSEELMKEYPDIKKTGNLPNGTTPQLNNAAGGIDGWTCMVWQPRHGMDIEMLRPHGQCYLKPTVGQMFIFPNWLHHEVYPFSGEGERLSIAMNWNVEFSDEHLLKGATEEQKNQYFETIENQKWEQEALAKARAERDNLEK